MPQMMPMNWMNLYIFMLIMIFMILILMYFMKFNNIKIMKKYFFKLNLMLFKW